ncbi:MAG TPA: anthrone oxygenase family protein [Ilumatobacteraceae bacterium]|nr:anthrone oxygenase family protein [Ilumatobacteraceae bacterium]
MRTIQTVTLIAATVSIGLVAGLLGAFACAVMPALRGADDRTFVDVMQRINVAIINPVFLSVFVGGLLVTVAAAAVHLPEDERDALPWIIAGLALYVVTLIITGRFNIPLNDELDAAGDPNGVADIHAVREQFESKWIAWNIARTITNVAACCCLAYALIVSGRASAGDDGDAAPPAAAIESSASERLVTTAPW